MSAAHAFTDDDLQLPRKRHLYLVAVDGHIVAPNGNRSRPACMRTGTSAFPINGDGLPDRVTATGNGLAVQLNIGYGFEAPETWTGGQLTLVSRPTVHHTIPDSSNQLF